MQQVDLNMAPHSKRSVSEISLTPLLQSLVSNYELIIDYELINY